MSRGGWGVQTGGVERESDKGQGLRVGVTMQLMVGLVNKGVGGHSFFANAVVAQLVLDFLQRA
jgi:hypothetical protein